MPDMTCQELHCYLENPLRTDVYMYRETLPASVSEHLDDCRECARLFEEQKALGISLNLTRDSAPQVPAALDAKVLANYRQQIAEPRNLPVHRLWNFPRVWMRWGVATAAVAAIALVLLFVNRKPAPVTVKRIVAPQAQVAPVAKQEQVTATGERAQTGTHSARKDAVPKVASANQLPAGFSSLMYCDELSCSGAMEVIRVELPSQPASSPDSTAGAPTIAEVLVGADGVARGIRIVQ
jgi:hypothetical protein